MDIFNIRPATEEEFNNTIQLPEIREAFKSYSGDNLPEYSADNYIIEYMDNYCIFYFKSAAENIVEGHLLIPAKHRKFARLLVLGILHWLKSRGIHTVITTCYTAKILNFAKKLGFKHVDTVGEKHFLVYSIN